MLTDENLLLPLLHALPEKAGGINVTMGYPDQDDPCLRLSGTARRVAGAPARRAGGTSFYHVDAAGILAHPYVARSAPQTIEQLRRTMLADRRIRMTADELGQTPLLKTLFTPAAEWRELSDYLLRAVAAVAREPYDGDDARQRVEFLAVISEQLIRLRNSLEACDIEITTSIYTSLLRRHLQTVRIPFEGEPPRRVAGDGNFGDPQPRFPQRGAALDERRQFPGQPRGAGFVHSLQPAGGFRSADPSPSRRGLYAYYFYRLVQRAERVYMLYCAHADEKTTGEQSHYIYQLDFETGFRVEARRGGGRRQSGGESADRSGEGGRRLGEALAFRRPRIAGDASPDGLFSVMSPVRCASISTRGAAEGRRRSDRGRSTLRCSERFSMPTRSGFTSGSRGRTIRAGRCVRWSEAGGRERAVAAAINSEYLQKRGGRREGSIRET